MQELNSLLDSFKDLPDPRSRNQDHPLLSILMIAICGAISGADNWVDIEAYGKAKHEWLKTLVALRDSNEYNDFESLSIVSAVLRKQFWAKVANHAFSLRARKEITLLG